MPWIIPAHVLAAPGRPGANDRLQVAFLGVGTRSRWMVTCEGLPGAEIVAVADCFLPRCHDAAALSPGGSKWRKYADYRRMLDREKLDAVFVETTTHARVLACIHAVQAGLDVYAEKPLTLTVAEGQALVQAVRHHGCVLQTGTQQRSMPANRYASQLIREGAIGNVHTVLACNFESPLRWSPKPAQPVPRGLDWDQWCGQTPLRPYHRQLQFGWVPLWAYDGGGQPWGVTGWGTHALDQVQCALGMDEMGPAEVWPEKPGEGAKVSMRYANGTVLKLHGSPRGHEDLGATFIGDQGKIEIRRGHFVADPKELLDGAPQPTPEGRGESVPHIENFFHCIRTREKPNADVEVGHRSTTVCHLVNICRQLGRRLQWDPRAETFPGDDEANRLLSRPRRKGYELPETA